MSSSSIFSGSSRYAADFKSVIDRAVAIASLPMKQMQADKQTMSDQSSALSSLDSRFTSLQSAISSLASATTSGTYSSSGSDDTVASASVSGTPLTGSYTIKVTDLGSYSTANSVAGSTVVANPALSSIGNGSDFKLTVGTNSFTISPAANTLNSLADAINGQTAAGVKATVINVGSSDVPDYRLSLQSTKLGGVAIGLSQTAVAADTGTDLTIRSGISKLTLTVGGQAQTPITASTPQDFADQINALAINGITAYVDVDQSLHITKPAGVAVEVGEDLLDGTKTTQGTPAKYSVNGFEIQGDSRKVTIASGLTAELKDDGGGTGKTTVITVSRNTAGISSALSAFVTAYNAASSEIANHHSATQKSALAGNSILATASQVLRSMVTYSNNGHFSSLVAGHALADSTSDLGITVDNSGKLSFDFTRFSNNTDGKISELLDMLGGTTTGGFLKVATDRLNALEDSTSGAIKAAITSTQDAISAQDDRISEKQDQIDELQKNLEARMAAADAAIAALEQKVSYFTGMFEAMKQSSDN